MALERFLGFLAPVALSAAMLACSGGESPASGAGSPGANPSGGSMAGSGGASAAGAGGAVTTGAGGATATGAGGDVTTGLGGAPATGDGGAVTTGAGGASSTGAGGMVSTGSGGAPTTGAGGGTSGAAGAIMRGAAPTEQSASSAGSFHVMRYSNGVPDSPSYGAFDIDYPTDATPPLAAVAIIPGFIEGRAAVADWGPFLASHGFAVITLDPNSNTDAPPARATALWAALGSLQSENARADSPLAGKIDVSRLAVMGHSMGGGGTLETANAHSAELRAAVPLAPWDTTTMFPGITAPTMIMAGQNDAIAPPAQHAMPFYRSIAASTEKAYVEFAGGDHFVADSPKSNTTAALLGLSWLKVHVEGDQRYQQFIGNHMGLSQFLPAP